MKLWIRVDAASPHDPKFSELGRMLAIRPAEAYGLCVAVWCGMAEHARDGYLASLDDRMIERWAMWDGKRGRFSTAFRAMFVDDDGTLRGWRDRQGKLAEQMEKDRKRHRKNPESSVEDASETPQDSPRSLRGISGATVTVTVTEDQNLTPKPPPDGGVSDSERPPLTIPAGAPRPKKGAAVRFVPTEDEVAVMAHYKRRFPARKPDKDDKAWRRIRAALEDYPVADLCKAIDGNADDPWHVERRKHELTYVLRDTGKIDDFIAKADAAEEFVKPYLERDPALAYAMGVVA